MSHKRPCHFYNLPSGCRRGAECAFAHIDSPGQGSRSAVNNSGLPPSPGDATASAAVPAGTCSFYWRTGDCNRGFDCRFKHDKSPELKAQATAQPSVSSLIAPFLTQAGLNRLFDVGSDPVFSANTKARSPTEVHNSLKRFLYDNYAFKNAPDVYAFLSLLTDATSNNSSWNAEDGQLLLSTIAKGNGLRRINDILSWSKISAKAVPDKMVLSFQRGYVPLFQYYSSDFVVKSILSHLINALYMLLMEHFDYVAEHIQSCMEQCINVMKSFGDTSSTRIGGAQVFGSLTVVLLQCLTRIKNATAKYPRMRDLVVGTSKWLDLWTEGISASPPTFRDPLTSNSPQTREQICQHLRTKANQLVAIVDREQFKAKRAAQPKSGIATGLYIEGTLAALHNSYVGPGDLRPEGPRHDNDHVEIAEIRIAPTHEELVCRVPPFLPANLYGAPHPLPAESMERLLDIQFRLLREELTAPLRISVQLVLDDMEKIDGRSQLSDLMQRRGGKYKGHSDGRDAVLFNLYTNAEFIEIKPDRRGLSISISIDTPPGRARAPDASRRVSFWEGMSGKRLLSGGLVALVWQTGTKTEVHLGTITSSIRDHTISARQSADRIVVRVAFFDPKVELAILRELRQPLSERLGTKLLIEATVMFASVKPFLEALRVEPTSVPFSRYLAHLPPGAFDTIKIEPPAYAKQQNFSFQLASLFPASEEVEDLKLNVSDDDSITAAREELTARSRLDPSQAEAVVDALTREVALIQGPPGTGKSYTGVELLRVLLANNVRPILMIAFTNHALDHMLCSVLDAEITKKVVRLGGRSADERIQKFSIEAMEEVAGRSRLDRAFASNHREVKALETKIQELMKECVKTSIDTDDILRHLQIHVPVFHEDFHTPPRWIHTLYQLYHESIKNGTAFVRVGKGGRDERSDNSLYTYWLSGGDLEFLQLVHTSPAHSNPLRRDTRVDKPSANSFAALADTDGENEDSDSSSESLAAEMADLDSDIDDMSDVAPEEAWMFVQPVTDPISEGDNSDENLEPQSQPPTISPDTAQAAPPDVEQPAQQNPVEPADFQDLRAFFAFCGCSDIPILPASDRNVTALADSDNIWDMSLNERMRLHEMWLREVQVSLQESRTGEYENLRRKYHDAVEKYGEGKAASRCELLRNVDIIGCTTTGAASLTAFLKTIGPRVMLVEEAGQVLEAHILASLVPSIQHMILIGDPQQLRPTLNNYSLSMEHKTGSMIYKFDMSLMERLSSSGFPMSQIEVQRRMRPSISELIRSTLYPKLEDHELVNMYPAVQGMSHDVFFMTHNHKENGGEDDQISKYNQFEVDFIVDLVMYLLRQGPYSGEGDIVVLCAYLGQLARMRDALAQKVAVVIDERDQRELADREAEQEDSLVQSTVEHVQVSRRVLLRTIDNFQGEEAKIIILSLVRNSGGSEEDNAVHGHSNVIRANVGFLRSENRTNVALSRAREGLYIFGNARDLSSRSNMWKSVITRLDNHNCLGTSLPVVCHRHPDAVQLVSRPGELTRISPDGGCLRQCDSRLSCGHLCPYKCHSDDPKHLSVKCEQSCTRLCPRGHPCSRSCADACGLCVTPVSQVELPCGHVKSAVSCHALDDLTQVLCNVQVRKQLPGCEHESDMRCSDDPADFVCNAVCDGLLACCGRSCKASCSQCQKLNIHARTGNDDEAPQIERVARNEHLPHPCERRLYCEHQCAEPCSTEHSCTTVCREPCRQVCPHARCHQFCSTPCAPCQELCTWRCLHFTCPLPCGSICARLPCDLRCAEVLQCGHRCPSVCGEDCSLQVCPTCATPDDKECIVDLILQRTMEDVDPELETLDELLITIPACGHTFTVETLDGHCSMTEYYRRESPEGKWIGLEAPPVGFRKPPTCPTCRAAITCPRYGRIFKRADLDILENNVAFNLSQGLHSVLQQVEKLAVPDFEVRLRSEAANTDLQLVAPPHVDAKLRGKNQRALTSQTRQVPLPWSCLDPASMELHAVSQAEAKVWNQVVRPFMIAYRDAATVSSRRSAHTHAWEASFSYLYQQEMQRTTLDPDHAPRNPHEHAMRVARLGVGQPQPRADRRFLVELFWVTINIRLTLAQLAQTWLASLGTRAKYRLDSRRRWQLFVAFVYRSCVHDAQLVLNIAQSSESHRQTVKTQLLVLRIDFEHFQFNVDTMRKGSDFKERRVQAAERATEKKREARQLTSDVVQQHLQIPRHDLSEERNWLETNFSVHAAKIMQEWEKLERSLISDTFYEPFSLHEMEGIVKGLSFSHTGHFYKCPQGHTFVIADVPINNLSVRSAGRLLEEVVMNYYLIMDAYPQGFLAIYGP